VTQEIAAGMAGLGEDGRGVGIRHLGFRVVLPSWTRTPEAFSLGLVNDKLTRVALRRGPMEHRQNSLFQRRGS
jgi:hypothetical protein